MSVSVYIKWPRVAAATALPNASTTCLHWPWPTSTSEVGDQATVVGPPIDEGATGTD